MVCKKLLENDRFGGFMGIFGIRTDLSCAGPAEKPVRLIVEGHVAKIAGAVLIKQTRQMLGPSSRHSTVVPVVVW
jgi:hypothetical protein